MRHHHHILLVEDNSLEVTAFQQALSDAGIRNPLHVALNGLEALEYLQNPANQRPGIIVLDLHMPQMDGIEFLKVVKQDSRLKCIPVIILTNSANEQDRSESFRHSVAGYMLKPVQHADFVALLKTIHAYWAASELID